MGDFCVIFRVGEKLYTLFVKEVPKIKEVSFNDFFIVYINILNKKFCQVFFLSMLVKDFQLELLL